MPARSDLIELRPAGLYCAAGDFYIDPWRPVERSVITHAHSDHARFGNSHYLATAAAEAVLRSRLGDIALQTLAYGERIKIGAATVSLHPAGHVLGSAQVRVEVDGEVWVASGDYKLQSDPTCTPFEAIRCDTFITESTFGLPIFRWKTTDEVMAEVNDWWRRNADAGRASVLFAYAFGKSQRILSAVDASIGPIFCHGAVESLNRAYRQSGVGLPEAMSVFNVTDKSVLKRALVVAPPSAQGSPWLKRFGEYSDAFASGWMQIRGTRRRRAVDRGFVLSDHADWPGLLCAIEATQAQRVFVTHGYVGPLVRWLQEHGLNASHFETPFGDENDEAVGDVSTDAAPAEEAPGAPPS